MCIRKEKLKAKKIEEERRGATTRRASVSKQIE